MPRRQGPRAERGDLIPAKNKTMRMLFITVTRTNPDPESHSLILQILHRKSIWTRWSCVRSLGGILRVCGGHGRGLRQRSGQYTLSCFLNNSNKEYKAQEDRNEQQCNSCCELRLGAIGGCISLFPHPVALRRSAQCAARGEKRCSQTRGKTADNHHHFHISFP